MTPCLRLRMESLLVNTGEALAPRYQEEEVAVAELSFLYGGGDGDADWFRHRFANPIERDHDREEVEGLFAPLGDLSMILEP